MFFTLKGLIVGGWRGKEGWVYAVSTVFQLFKGSYLDFSHLTELKKKIVLPKFI